MHIHYGINICGKGAENFKCKEITPNDPKQLILSYLVAHFLVNF